MDKLQQNRYTLTGAVLKNIACFTMLTDHFFAILFYNYMRLHPVNGAWDPQLEKVYRMGRAVGRISFILFAYLIVEGVIYTGSRGRYLLRLFLFALLSEIPFDLAFSGKAVDWSAQNIYWTLFLGALTLTLWEQLGRYRCVWLRELRWVVVTGACMAAFQFAFDYRFMGILLIFVLYQTHGKPLGISLCASGIIMFSGTWMANLIRYGDSFTAAYLFRFSLREMYGLFAFIPIFLYNGKRGRQLPKPFYYGFYPAHLLLLYGNAKIIGVM